MKALHPVVLGLLILPLVVLPKIALAGDFDDVKERVVEHTLENGLRLIIFERHNAPVASFVTLARVGAVDEKPGITGLAHLFEHMAFKGTDTIGTLDYEAELEAIGKVDAAYQALVEARQSAEDPDRVALLEEAFAAAQKEASDFVQPEFDRILQVHGGVGLNAGTSSDWTIYLVSLPSNKMELWAALESERFLKPVLREFYKERSVVQEERRLRTDSSPFGRFLEESAGGAFRAHPYGWPVVGHMSDLQSLTREDAREFFETYYVASNLIVGVVGDVDSKEVIETVEKYFGRLPKRPPPPRVRTVEPPQKGERIVYLEDPTNPIYAGFFHKPAASHPDDIIFDALVDILGSGRTSRLYKTLVKEKKVAVQVSAFSGQPGNRYPNLFGTYAIPAAGKTADDVETEILGEIERLKKEPVTEEELNKVKTRSRASVIRGLSSNMGMARQLVFFEDITGDWRDLFHQVERIQEITPEDVQRVAQEYLIRKNRTTAKLVKTPMKDVSE